MIKPLLSIELGRYVLISPESFLGVPYFTVQESVKAVEINMGLLKLWTFIIRKYIYGGPVVKHYVETRLNHGAVSFASPMSMAPCHGLHGHHNIFIDIGCMYKACFDRHTVMLQHCENRFFSQGERILDRVAFIYSKYQWFLAGRVLSKGI